MLEKAKVYAPEQVQEWEKPAMAYQLRHLARRAVTLEDGETAVELAHRAIAVHSRLLLEEPHKTLLTLSAAYTLRLLPRSFYSQVENFAFQMAGALQRRRILQDKL
jgi:broad specificity phosphatase PhoE